MQVWTELSQGNPIAWITVVVVAAGFVAALYWGWATTRR